MPQPFKNEKEKVLNNVELAIRATKEFLNENNKAGALPPPHAACKSFSGERSKAAFQASSSGPSTEILGGRQR